MQDHQGQLDHQGQKVKRANKVMMGKLKAPQDHLATEVQLATEEIEGILETLATLVKKDLMGTEEKLDSKVYPGILDHQASQDQRDPKVKRVKKESKGHGVQLAAEARRALLGYLVRGA